ncbi:ATP-grasp domain-containing protein [Pseudoduganella lurida]|uniref:ATP-grasp domain-containing protein n=1 Tax=Pseudoduganella lurida TaxID=1036180 RepID=A0A562R5B0_9BURK|nr:ATP-grasp domain-containing protein [Pseudoduganella lurida]TWI63566.1 ATP-grasp domain-containing protein [Pseudoduganella lurida]
MRVWFNRTFSSVATAMRLIRQEDRAGRYRLIYTAGSAGIAAAAADHFELEPKLKGEEYLAWCLDFCRRHEVGIFVPGREAALISGAAERFAAMGTRVLTVGSPAVLELLHDKARFYATVDLPLAAPPETLPFTTLAGFDAAHAVLRAKHGKLCVKPSQSVYGLGFAILDERRSSAQLLLAGEQYHIGLEDLRTGLGQLEDFRTMLLMEYLDGHEYSVDCVGDAGRLVCAVPRRKPMAAGTGQVIDPRADILAATAKLTADYGLNGLFNVQFREHEGRLRLLEINPRMSGGIGMACLAGPVLPYVALAGFDQGFDRIDIPPVRAGVRVAEAALPVVLAEDA